MTKRYYRYLLVLAGISCILPSIIFVYRMGTAYRNQNMNFIQNKPFVKIASATMKNLPSENSKVTVNSEKNGGCRHIGKQILPGSQTASSALNEMEFVSEIWQSVDDNCYFYVYSAYVDDLDWKIRIMGIARMLNTTVSMRCHIWKTSDDLTQETVDGNIWYLPDVMKKSYSAVIMSCPILKGSRPFAVSVTVNNSHTIKHIIKITHPSKNKTDITVCFPSLHSNYKRTDSIFSFIEMNKILGAQRFVIYNHSVNPEVSLVLNEYVKEGILEIVQWDTPVKDIHYFGQNVIINDCLYRNLHVSNYLVYSDLDEIILPRKHENWMNLIKSVRKREPNVGSIMFRNTFFLTNAEWKIDTEGYKQSKEARKYGVIPLLRVWRDKFIFPPKSRSKQIVIPERVRAVRIHLVNKDMYRNKFKVHVVSPEYGLLHHYRWMSGVKQNLKDDIIRTYSDLLLTRIKTKHSNFITAKVKNRFL